jgi:hypothetical protein
MAHIHCLDPHYKLQAWRIQYLYLSVVAYIAIIYSLVKFTGMGGGRDWWDTFLDD